MTTVTTSDDATAYRHSIAALPNHKCAPAVLDKEIRAVLPSLLRVDTSGDDCDAVFPAALSANDQATLDGVVAAHQGVQVEYVLHTTTKLIAGVVDITSTTDWQLLGGVAAKLSYFVPDPAKQFTQVFGVFSTDGAGAELRIVEEKPTDGSLVVLSDVLALADKAGGSDTFRLPNTTAPRAGDMIYRLEGRLNGATSASVRYVSGALFEVVTS